MQDSQAQQRSWLNRLYMLILGSEEGVVSLHSGFVILRDCIFTLHWATGRRATGWTAEQDESWLCRLADLATPMATRSKSLCRIMSHERLFPAISLSENTPVGRWDLGVLLVSSYAHLVVEVVSTAWLESDIMLEFSIIR